MTRRRGEEQVRADVVVGPGPLIVWNGAVTRLRRIGVETPEEAAASTVDVPRAGGREPARSPPRARQHA